MVDMIELKKYMYIYKNFNVDDSTDFCEIIDFYDNIIYLLYSFMKSYSHCLTNVIYGICFLIDALYKARYKAYKSIGLLEIDDDFVKTIIKGLPKNFDKNAIVTFEKIISPLIGKSIIRDVKKGFDYINESVLKEMKNELIKQSFEEINDYCKDITKDDIAEKFDKIFEYDDIGTFEHEILNEQIKKNHKPDISKEEFFEKYPEFKKALDKHGLIDLSFDNFELLKRYNLEGVYYKDYFIYFDDLFRCWDSRLFLDIFLNHSRQGRKNTIFKIKLNYDKIISLKKFKYVMLIEGAYFGPDYNPDKFFIKEDKKPVLTVKIRESEEFNKRFGNFIERTEFKFDPKNNSFLVEEVGRNENNGFYINRLMHSEFNTEIKKVKHFDGSLLSYDTNLYYKRENTDLLKLLKQEKLEECKIKLFQIDGEIDINEREDLFLSYYEGNELVLEYLDESAYKSNYEEILS